MANIPPQENWFSISTFNVATTAVGTNLIEYTCPVNRCANITGWLYQEDYNGSTIGLYFMGKGFTSPMGVDRSIIVAHASSDLYAGPYHNMQDLRLGPGDMVAVKTITEGGGSWSLSIFVREIGPCSNNMGSWTES